MISGRRAVKLAGFIYLFIFFLLMSQCKIKTKVGVVETNQCLRALYFRREEIAAWCRMQPPTVTPL